LDEDEEYVVLTFSWAVSPCRKKFYSIFIQIGDIIWWDLYKIRVVFSILDSLPGAWMQKLDADGKIKNQIF